jgi:hypothetical protein
VYLNPIDDFVPPLELVVLVLFVCTATVTLIQVLVLRKDWGLEFKVTPVELKIHELVNQLADHLAIPRPQRLDLEVLDVGQPKFLEVSNHLA